jgi:hypothetical protein
VHAAQLVEHRFRAPETPAAKHGDVIVSIAHSTPDS